MNENTISEQENKIKEICSSCLCAEEKGNFVQHNEYYICKRCKQKINVDFQQLIVNFVVENPFFAYISRYISKIESNKIPTIGVKADPSDHHVSLIYNKKFLDSLLLCEKYELFKHEFYHIMFSHIFLPDFVGGRLTKSTNSYLWNIACDLAINSLLDKNRLPKCGFIPGVRPIITPNHQKYIDGIKSEKIKTKYLSDLLAVGDFIVGLPTLECSEWYYKKLLENKHVSDILMDNLELIIDFSSTDSHDDWIDSLSKEQQESFKDQIRVILKESILEADRNKKWGNISCEQQKYLRKYVSKQINWTDILKIFLGKCRSPKKIKTIKKINRKYPYIHPGSKNNRIARIAIAIDQSGSVSDETLELFFAELKNLSQKTEFTVIPFDSRVNESEIFIWKKNKDVNYKRVNFGGTDFNVPTKWVNEHNSKFDGFIILTDGYCSKPIASKVRRAYIISPDGDLQFETNEMVIKMKNKNG